MSNRSGLIVAACLLLCFNVSAQKQDSLWSLYENAYHDTTRVRLLTMICTQEVINRISFWDSIATEANKWELCEIEGGAVNNIGFLFVKQGFPLQGLETYEAALDIHKSCGDTMGWSRALQNIGDTYEDLGLYPQAVKAYYESLDIKQLIGDLKGMSEVYNNLGFIFKQENQNDRALEYYVKSIDIKLGLNDREGYAITLSNIAAINERIGEVDNALANFQEALEIGIEFSNDEIIATNLNHIGSMMGSKGDTLAMLEYYQQSLHIREIMGEPSKIVTMLSKVGNVFLSIGSLDSAIIYSERAYELASTVNYPRSVRISAELMTKVHAAMGNWKLAFEYFQINITMKDSIVSVENQEELLDAKLRYEYNEMHVADSLGFENNRKLDELAHQNQLESEQQERHILYGGLSVLLLLVGMAFRSYRLKRNDNKIIAKQKKEVEHQRDEVEFQKRLIEEKSQEITDSITYAKRIQEAILPSNRAIMRYLPDSFIYYKPKDIVAGDFYWVERIGEWTYFAAADCTGHGVPGAMVSVVCHEALNRAVREFKLVEPGEILDKVNSLVEDTFAKSEEQVSDGMDIALCRLNFDTGHLNYSGAHNPLWIKRLSGEEFDVIRADKQPIGSYNDHVPYTTHRVKLNPGDIVYIFSDGFPDQFGGEKNKKYKYKPFQQFLKDISSIPIADQARRLDEELGRWKGNLEQVDDICIIGVIFS